MLEFIFIFNDKSAEYLYRFICIGSTFYTFTIHQFFRIKFFNDNTNLFHRLIVNTILRYLSQHLLTSIIRTNLYVIPSLVLPNTPSITISCYTCVFGILTVDVFDLAFRTINQITWRSQIQFFSLNQNTWSVVDKENIVYFASRTSISFAVRVVLSPYLSSVHSIPQ